MSKHEPVWNVFVEDFNGKEIKIFNVFHSHRFIDGCKKAVKQYKKDKDIVKFEDEIRSWAIYSFAYKCEYEVLITGWIKQDAQKKIDVYEQLKLNWDSFFKYIVDNISDFK